MRGGGGQAQKNVLIGLGGALKRSWVRTRISHLNLSLMTASLSMRPTTLRWDNCIFNEIYRLWTVALMCGSNWTDVSTAAILS